MDQPTLNPLEDEHCACLNKVLDSTPGTKSILDRCKAAGIPCDELLAENARHQQMAANLKSSFFPYAP